METEDIVGRWINHKTHGKGKILEFDGKKIFVKFLNGDEFYFKYPDFNYERYFTFCTEVYNLDEDFDDGDDEDDADADKDTTFRRSRYWNSIDRLIFGEYIDDAEFCNECGEELVIEKGPYGFYYRCDACGYTRELVRRGRGRPKKLVTLKDENEFIDWLNNHGFNPDTIKTYVTGARQYMEFLEQNKC